MRGVRCTIHLMFQFCCEQYFSLAYSAISAINCGSMIEVVGADLMTADAVGPIHRNTRRINAVAVFRFTMARAMSRSLAEFFGLAGREERQGVLSKVRRM